MSHARTLMSHAAPAAGINDTGGKFATGINNTGANFSTSFASVVDTGGKFFTGVNDTGGKQWEQLSNC
jgi:hypothetical protein